jgi:hypothetical protein
VAVQAGQAGCGCAGGRELRHWRGRRGVSLGASQAGAPPRAARGRRWLGAGGRRDAEGGQGGVKRPNSFPWWCAVHNS